MFNSYVSHYQGESWGGKQQIMRISSETDGMDVTSPSQLVGNGTFQVQKAIMVLLDCQYTLQKHHLSSR